MLSINIYTDFDVPLSFHRENHLSLGRGKNFLSIFGHLLKLIKWEINLGNLYEKEIFESIVEFCGKSLLRLHIRSHSLNFSNGSQFILLEELKLIDVIVQSLILHYRRW